MEEGRSPQVEVREELPDLDALAREIGLHECVASATANRAWLSWLAGDDAEGESAARASLLESRTSAPSCPFEWLALFPLLAIAITRGDQAEAADIARQLLAPGQQLLAPEVMAVLQAAVTASSTAPGTARETFRTARDAAILAGYL